MPKYYDIITDTTKLDHKMGSALSLSEDFFDLSSVIISKCNFIQYLVQQIIFKSHGAELLDAKGALRTFPNPKARFDFLCSYPYTESDPVVAKVFEFSRLLFQGIYKFRNVLVHEIWSSSETYPRSVVFSSLDEHSKLLMASGRIWHVEGASPRETYDATVSFIRSVKLVNLDHMHTVISDIDICSWSLMHIDNILGESNAQRRDEARKAFFVFQGTSHLFDVNAPSSELVEYSSSNSKEIFGD